MIGSVIVISIIFTIVILALTLLTISQGYGYKHTIDPQTDHENEEQMNDSKN